MSYKQRKLHGIQKWIDPDDITEAPYEKHEERSAEDVQKTVEKKPNPTVIDFVVRKDVVSQQHKSDWEEIGDNLDVISIPDDDIDIPDDISVISEGEVKEEAIDSSLPQKGTMTPPLRVYYLPTAKESREDESVQIETRKRSKKKINKKK